MASRVASSQNWEAPSTANCIRINESANPRRTDFNQSRLEVGRSHRNANWNWWNKTYRNYLQYQKELITYKLSQGHYLSRISKALMKKNFRFNEDRYSSCIFGYLFGMNNRLVLFVLFNSDIYCLNPETGRQIFSLDWPPEIHLGISINKTEDVLLLRTDPLFSGASMVYQLDLMQVGFNQ